MAGEAVRGQGRDPADRTAHGLVHTHWSDVSGLPDAPENYQEVTWALSERDGSTELTITERNLPSEETKAVSEASWKTALTSLKAVLEDSGSP